MRQESLRWYAIATVCMTAVWPGITAAHDPVFGLGPHVLYKDGYEVHLGLDQSSQSVGNVSDLEMAFMYGLTGDWAVGIEVPLVSREAGMTETTGFDHFALQTKYRFWRDDSLGTQSSMAILAKAIVTEDDTTSTARRTDALLGLTYGYESRKWYRWAAVRYLRRADVAPGFSPGDRTLIDLVGGIRIHPSGYYEPDTVWMLELNGELTDRSRQGGAALVNSGGEQWFVSPGMMWTYRNFAVKAGVQVPLIDNLNGDQAQDDYRARLELEMHF